MQIKMFYKTFSFPFEYQSKNQILFVQICVVWSALCKEMSKVQYHNSVSIFISPESYVSLKSITVIITK
jgi:hypothetical protein